MELPPEEQPLEEISKFVYRDEEKSRNLWKYVFEKNYRGKGIEFEEIQRYIEKAATEI